jgi:hypothetical protein
VAQIANLLYRREFPQAAQILECGGKRSVTPLWIGVEKALGKSKAPSPLRSAGALQIVLGCGFVAPRKSPRADPVSRDYVSGQRDRS